MISLQQSVEQRHPASKQTSDWNGTHTATLGFLDRDHSNSPASPAQFVTRLQAVIHFNHLECLSCRRIVVNCGEARRRIPNSVFLFCKTAQIKGFL